VTAFDEGRARVTGFAAVFPLPLADGRGLALLRGAGLLRIAIRLHSCDRLEKVPRLPNKQFLLVGRVRQDPRRVAL